MPSPYTERNLDEWIVSQIQCIYDIDVRGAVSFIKLSVIYFWDFHDVYFCLFKMMMKIMMLISVAISKTANRLMSLMHIA